MSEPKYPYRNLTDEELIPGFRCERRVHGEYDTQVTCSSPEGYDRFNLTDEVGWLWIETNISEQDIIHFKDYYQRFNSSGMFRVKT